MQAKEISTEVKKEAVRQVEATSWLTRQTSSKVIQKIATTKFMVDIPNFYLNHTAIVDSLTGINISNQDFFKNFITMISQHRKQLHKLIK